MGLWLHCYNFDVVYHLLSRNSTLSSTLLGAGGKSEIVVRAIQMVTDVLQEMVTVKNWREHQQNVSYYIGLRRLYEMDGAIKGT